MMFQALKSLIASEDLLYAITAIKGGMSVHNAPSWEHRKPRPRKKCPYRLIMALDLWPNIRLHGIRLHIKFHGIKLLNTTLLGFMHHDIKYLSISDLSSNLYLPITVAAPRSNPSTLKGRRRWKIISTTESHLFGCRAWWSGWGNKWIPASNHLQEGRIGSRRTRAVTPWGGTDALSKSRCSCLGFGP